MTHTVRGRWVRVSSFNPGGVGSCSSDTPVFWKFDTSPGDRERRSRLVRNAQAERRREERKGRL